MESIDRNEYRRHGNTSDPGTRVSGIPEGDQDIGRHHQAGQNCHHNRGNAVRTECRLNECVSFCFCHFDISFFLLRLPL